MKNLLTLIFFISLPTYSIVNLPVDMGRTTQTLNQVDKASDGKTTRNQGQEVEGAKSSPTKSYNDESHREYVRRQKAKQKKK